MEDIKEIDEPSQRSNKQFVFDMNKFNYTLPDQSNSILDWNKLCYCDDQISEFVIKKNANYMPPEAYSYLFKPELTAWEEHILLEKGVDLDDRVIPEEPIYLLPTYMPTHEAGSNGENGENGIHEDTERTIFGIGTPRPLFKKQFGKGVVI
jgi:hypothetical protein